MKKILKLMLTASVIAAMQFIAACGDDSKDGNFPPPPPPRRRRLQFK